MRKKKGKILGYRNLGKLHAGLQPIVILRKKHDVLEQLSNQFAYDAEEPLEDVAVSDGAESGNMDSRGAASGNGGEAEIAAAVFAGQSPEKMEAVLNQGMAFIGGLLEMATGTKIDPVGTTEKMVNIDRETGEVTMKFKLPGF